MAVRIGVIGAGGMGREHIANLSALPDVDVVVVADISLDSAAHAASTVGAEATTEAAAVAAWRDLDGVVIATPDDTHADLAIAAIDTGHFVLCEKPLATNVDDAQRVIDAERKAGRAFVQLGFMRPYDSAHVQVREALAELGDIQHIRCVHRNTNDQWSRALDVVFSQSLIHDVHTARWLSGSEFTSVVTQVVARDRPVDHVVVVGELADGSTATLEFVEATYGYDVEVEVTARHGMVACAQPAQPVIRRDGAGHRFIGDDWFGRFRDAYRLEVADWVAGVRSGEVRGATTGDGMAAQRVVAAAIVSAETGQRVAV